MQVNPVWALREQKGHRRFSADVCAFLLQEFMKGVNTGIKENPTDTARKLKARFTKEHWLSVQLVASYFSRLSSRQKCGRLPTTTATAVMDDDPNIPEVAVQEALSRYSLRKRVQNEVGY
ncbi:MAG: hypothetical protein MJA29_01695 [Candidatus Omnitrophica bacterium]|nr:hypothetical protein [Candidatus Omnitrophota bacterium]